MESIMPEQEQGKKPKQEEDQGQVEAQDLTEKGDELKEDIDSLMDEIDIVLEENSREFVDAYVQRNGE